MPKASHSVQVKAPVDVVWRILLDKIENPGATVPGVESARIVDREAGFVVRQMRVNGMELTERVTAFAQSHEVDYLLLDHPLYAGQVVNRIEPPLRPGLACTLSFALDWRRKDGQPDTLDLQPAIVQSVEKIKALAEKRSGGEA